MKIAVWDTYIRKRDGGIMHFDILVPADEKDQEKIFAFGRAFMAEKNHEEQTLNIEQCSFCHVETATPEMLHSISNKGFYIIEIQGCD